MKSKLLTSTLFALAALSTQGGCFSTNSSTGTTGSAASCEELAAADIDPSLKVDADVKVFMQTTADSRALAARIKLAVKTSCAQIATDLGGADSWTALGDGNDAISNKQGTGACDVATAHVNAILQTSEAASANFAILVTSGSCHTDFQEQIKCDAKCTTETSCDSGTVETRCTPGQLSVICAEKCKTKSVCEGTLEIETTCTGSCEATCHGACKGRCTAENGDRTNDDAACHGKCAGSCTGTCSGSCTIELEGGITCTDKIRCKGECTTTHTDPVCETEYTPPTCKQNTTCADACITSIAAKRVCTPPTVKVLANVSASADVAKLVATLNTNLAMLVQVAEEESELIKKVVVKLGVSAQAIAGKIGSLDEKSIACGGRAVKDVADASATINVSIEAGGSLTQACRTHADLAP